MPLSPHEPVSLADYLETMSRAVFTAGMGAAVIDRKWAGTVEAFDGFDPAAVAAYTPADVERLLGDDRIVRNRKKVEATVHNAGELMVVEREFGGIRPYLDSFADTEDLIADLHRRFRFLGESVARMFLYAVAFREKEQEAWAREHFGEAAMRRHGH
jgi:3-methyladenine DNA glycosylase Tag